MVHYVADNLLLFRKQFNQIYHVIRNKERDVERYQIIHTRSNYPTLEIQEADKASVFMHSKYDPVYEAEQWLDKSENQIGDASHILVFGMGLGYHIEAIIRKYPERKLYIIEPEIEHTLAAMEARDLSLILNHRNITVMSVGKDKLVFQHAAILMSNYIDSSLSVLYPPFYTKHYKDEIEQFTAIFRGSVLDARVNLHTHIRFKTEWSLNSIMNIPQTLFSRSIWPLKKQYEGCPMLVVGSGPSLDYNLEYLRELQHHIPIIAAGSSTKALLSAGVRPHMIVSMDGGAANYKIFRDLDTEGIPFVYSPMIQYQILEQVPQEDLHHVFISTDTLFKYLFDTNKPMQQIYSAASVTGVAMQLAAYFGSDNIILVGQDLSYPNHIMYANNVGNMNKEDAASFADECDAEVENVQGGMNPTQQKMLATLSDIEQIVSIHADECNFMNTSHFGAKIKGTTDVSLDNLLDKLKSNDMGHERFKQVWGDNTSDYTAREKKIIVDKIKMINDRLLKVQKQAISSMIKCMNNLEKALEVDDTNKISSSLIHINRYWEELTSEKIFDPVIGNFFQASILVYSRYVPRIVETQDPSEKGKLVLKHLGNLINMMNDDIPKLVTLMDSSLERVQERLLVNH
ncbi:MAG: 6-hydroxymethylpterin diphosphokinase MptE-like protein [Candidatus Pristimantibacillus sp.]